jgi:hypothetical protein
MNNNCYLKVHLTVKNYCSLLGSKKMKRYLLAFSILVASGMAQAVQASANVDSEPSAPMLMLVGFMLTGTIIYRRNKLKARQ